MSSLVVRQSLIPMVIFYIVIMVVLAVGLRMSRRAARAAPAADRDSAGGDSAGGDSAGGDSAGGNTAGGRPLIKARPGWLGLITQYAFTAVGGYLLLMAVCIIYYFGVARVGGNFIESAVTGCALLMGLSAPVFLVVSWLTARRG